jgi:hypothetical protein
MTTGSCRNRPTHPLCVGCPLLAECRHAADERDERWHVWGGHDYTRRPRTTGSLTAEKARK